MSRIGFSEEITTLNVISHYIELRENPSSLNTCEYVLKKKDERMKYSWIL